MHARYQRSPRQWAASGQCSLHGKPLSQLITLIEQHLEAQARGQER